MIDSLTSNYRGHIMTTVSNEAAADRITTAAQAVRDAEAAFEQAVRDEIKSNRINPSDVARALGTKNRQRVYDILRRGEDEAPAAPVVPPVVYLRGAGCGAPIWERVIDAMHSRGWTTVRDRTSAWHLARGGMQVMICDFSSSNAAGLYATTVKIGQVRAKYGDEGDMELPLTSGGELERPERFDDDAVNNIGQKGAITLDVDKLARMVAEAFGD